MTEFKIGDKVKYIGWNREHAGKKGTVTGTRDIAYRVAFNEYEYQYAKSEELTLLPTPTTTHQFQEGDKVRVVSKIVPPDWDNTWVKAMDDYIGKEFTVDNIDFNGVYFVDNCYWFPPESLELVSNHDSPQVADVVPVFKIGDRVQAIGSSRYFRMDNAVGTVASIQDYGKGPFCAISLDPPFSEVNCELSWFAHELKLLPAVTPVVKSFDWSLLEDSLVVASKQCCTREDAIKWARQEVASITGEDGTFTLTQHTPVMTFTKTSKIEETTHE